MSSTLIVAARVDVSEARDTTIQYKVRISAPYFCTSFILSICTPTTAQAPQNAQNADALRQLFEAVRRICRIYLSLNFQEHPDFFASKTNDFWSTFLELLKYENPLLADADEEDVPSVLDRVKAAIGDIACLFAEKYEEDFRAFVAPFVTQVRARWRVYFVR